MNLQVRKLSGNVFTAEDLLELHLISEGASISRVVHHLELVSGPDVLHGGGASADTPLHYYTPSEDGSTPYTEDVTMVVEQVSQGTSVIKVVAEVVTADMMSEFNHNADVWSAHFRASGLTHEEYTVPEPVLEHIALKSSEIILQSGEDSFA